ncbi:MAG: hypothetical protein ACLUOI_37635 [Eisenbergiella sp.]
MIQIMEKAIDWKKEGIQKIFVTYNADEAGICWLHQKLYYDL